MSSIKNKKNQQPSIERWILTMERPSADTKMYFILWLELWLVNGCLSGGRFCRNLTSPNQVRTNGVAFPWDTGGWFRLKSTELCTGQPWGIPHVQRCKSVILTPNDSDLSLLTCKWIYIYSHSIQNTATEGIATPVEQHCNIIKYLLSMNSSKK